jgi:hypothetical protein
LGLQLSAVEEIESVHFEVFKSNLPVIKAFFALDDCAWQYTDMGQLIGLDYPVAHVIWASLGITLTHDEFSGLMLFARVICVELNKRMKK